MRRAGLIAGLVALACVQAQGKPPPRAVDPQATQQDLDVTDEAYVMPPLPHARLTLTDAFGGAHVVDAEVAADAPSRTRGLMWRTELADGKGMVFLFPQEQPLSFWMKNTLIPLDMIFITKDWKIAGVVEHAQPRTTSPRAVSRPSMYVLEVPDGWASKVGLKAGLPVKAEGLRGVVARPD